MFTEEEYLALSGIQHYAFCPRQWALIHIEQQWTDNLLTMEGNILHQKVDDPFNYEKRHNTLIVRAVPVSSGLLGFYGVCDIVEYERVDNPADAVELKHRKGFFRPVPVEYKRGRPKNTYCDCLQLCAQAMCLEEKHGVPVKSGSVYYGQTRHRIAVELGDDLRKQVYALADEMHRVFDSGITPPPSAGKHCKACSLAVQCLPQTKNGQAVQKYLLRAVNEEG
ncbi:MAG: CRISPR-associated protein Cas4 [Bacillota bacterium]